MAVFRVERSKDYTVMSNHHLRNKELTLKAKGLLSQMLSLPEDWDYTLKGLAAINRESIDAIRTAVLKDGVAHVQAGAGLVADSDPAAEDAECLHKAAAALNAVAAASGLARLR